MEERKVQPEEYCPLPFDLEGPYSTRETFNIAAGTVLGFLLPTVMIRYTALGPSTIDDYVSEVIAWGISAFATIGTTVLSWKYGKEGERGFPHFHSTIAGGMLGMYGVYQLRKN